MFEAVKQEILSQHEDYRKQEVTGPTQANHGAVQPRAMVVAHRSQTVWLASEGDDVVAQYRIHSAAPMERSVGQILVGRFYKDPKLMGDDSYSDGIAAQCGAPTGLALSEDENTLFVFCRSTYDVATIHLSTTKASEPTTLVRVAEDPLGDVGSRGRRLFYGARDGYSSGGVGCAGCHPDGRDDGHVWHEVVLNQEHDIRMFLAHQNLADKTNGGRLGFARQTPMLAGRVNSSGPFGWHAQDKNLTERLADGFSLHRWSESSTTSKVDAKHWLTGERANALGVFLRSGLVSPPALGRPLTETELAGKKIFESEGAQCTQCHAPETELTNRGLYNLQWKTAPAGYEDDVEPLFKTPSLLFVGGTPPYYHDGSAATLADLVNGDHDRMGKTDQLSQTDRDALIAYLETL